MVEELEITRAGLDMSVVISTAGLKVSSPDVVKLPEKNEDTELDCEVAAEI